MSNAVNFVVICLKLISDQNIENFIEFL